MQGHGASVALPHLLVYTKRRRATPPTHGMQCPPGLQAALLHNGLEVDNDTESNGNCGVDAFGRCLIQTARRNKALASTNAYKQLHKNSKSTQVMINHLRSVARKWMEANGSLTLWEGMTFQQLAVYMAGLGARTYAD